MHVLKLARKQANGTLNDEDEEEIEVKPTLSDETMSDEAERTTLVNEEYDEDEVDNPDSVFTEGVDDNLDAVESEHLDGNCVEYLVEGDSLPSENFEGHDQTLEIEGEEEGNLDQNRMEIVESTED